MKTTFMNSTHTNIVDFAMNADRTDIAKSLLEYQTKRKIKKLKRQSASYMQGATNLFERPLKFQAVCSSCGMKSERVEHDAVYQKTPYDLIDHNPNCKFKNLIEKAEQDLVNSMESL